MTNLILTSEQLVELLKSNRIYLKYVRLEDDTIRLCRTDEMGTPDHRQMIEEGEKVKSAAYLEITYQVYRGEPEREFRTTGNSMTLKSHQLPDDQDVLIAYLKQFGLREI